MGLETEAPQQKSLAPQTFRLSSTVCRDGKDFAAHKARCSREALVDSGGRGTQLGQVKESFPEEEIDMSPSSRVLQGLELVDD